MEDSIGKIVLRSARADGLVMSRVPKTTRDDFIALATEEFAGDYGMCFKMIFDSFKLWKMYFENSDMKLDKIIELLQTLESNSNEEKPDKIKFLSGRIAERRLKKNG